jgi:GAF domain-containing protein
MAFIFRRQGEVYRLAANCGFPPAYEAFLKGVALSPGRATVTGRAALEGHAVHVVDILADPEYDIPETYGLGKSRTVLSVPLLREKVPIGMITVARQRVEPFTNKQVELVTTFADQAVIAIENVRLFDEVQAQKRELSDALKHQTATSEVLNVITRSPTDAQPVFDAIVQSAARLCEAMFSVVFLYDGDLLQLAATHNLTPEVLNKLFQTYPKRPDRSILSGRAVLDGKVAHVPDLLADREYSHQLALAGNWGSALAVPMLRDGKPAGAISVAKAEAVPFSERQIQLLTTFADQAVIAIGNVRLFDEVQARTQELSASLQQQTATADVLKIISRSTFDLKSVLQTLVESAARLCEADKATITRQIGGAFFRAEAYGFSAEFMDYVRALPVEPEAGTASGRALLEGRIIHIPDVLTDPNYTFAEAQKLAAIAPRSASH